MLSGSTPIAEHTDVAESSALAASEIAVSTSCWAPATAERAAARPSGASAGRSASARVTCRRESTKERPAEPPTSELTSLPAIASARISWALSSAASFDRTVTSRSAVSSWASCWPVVTVSPTATSTVVTVPELGKATSAWATGWIVATPSSVAVTACWLAVAKRYTVGFEPVVWATARPPPASSTSTTAAVTVRRMRRRRRYALLVISLGNREATRSVAGWGFTESSSLAPQGVDGREAGGAGRGVDAEDDADGDGHGDGADGRRHGEDHLGVGELRQDDRHRRCRGRRRAGRRPGRAPTPRRGTGGG